MSCPFCKWFSQLSIPASIGSRSPDRVKQEPTVAPPTQLSLESHRFFFSVWSLSGDTDSKCCLGIYFCRKLKGLDVDETALGIYCWWFKKSGQPVDMVKVNILNELQGWYGNVRWSRISSTNSRIQKVYVLYSLKMNKCPWKILKKPPFQKERIVF